MREKREEAAAARLAPVVHNGDPRPPTDWLSDTNGAAGGAPDAEVGVRSTVARKTALDLAKAVLFARHGVTADHSDDVGLLCEEVADELGIKGTERANLMAAAQLHDLGKVAVPAQILDKPGPLTEEEWEVVREHTPVGQRILASVPEMEEVARIVRHTHEHWDGSGYPDGLAGDEIPLASRVVLCADAFHAIRSDRPYRSGRSAAGALAELKANAATQFDPVVVAALERAAGRLRSPAPERFATARAALRSRRLIALLLALAASGSAIAAVQSGLFGGDQSKAADAPRFSCSTHPCRLLDLGPFPPLFKPKARSGPAHSASHAHPHTHARAHPRRVARGPQAGINTPNHVLGVVFRSPHKHAGSRPAKPHQHPTPAPPEKQVAPAPVSPAPKKSKPKKDGQPGNAYGHEKRLENPNPPKPPPGQLKEKPWDDGVPGNGPKHEGGGNGGGGGED